MKCTHFSPAIEGGKETIISTPPKTNIGCQAWPLLKGVTCSKAHHFGIQPLVFGSVYFMRSMVFDVTSTLKRVQSRTSTNKKGTSCISEQR